MRYQFYFIVETTETTPYGTDSYTVAVCDPPTAMARLPTIADSNSTQLNVDHYVMYLEIFSSMKFVA